MALFCPYLNNLYKGFNEIFFWNSEKTRYLRKKKTPPAHPAMRIFKTTYLGDHVQQVTG